MNDLPHPFSKWIHWDCRDELDGIDQPGVYAIARFDGKVPTHVSWTNKAILYIGETTKRSLKKRLTEFNRSAFSGKPANYGGRTFHAKFRRKKVPPWLYVSICIPEGPPKCKAPFIKYLEKRFIWEYVKANGGKQPACNR